MYGNVGLPTARGSGTNGYVQRNLSFIKKKYKPGNYKEIINQFKLNPLQSKKRIDNEIIEHEIKYKIEVELYELKEKLEKEGMNEIEIENTIKLKREELKNKLLKNQNDFIDKKETHSINKLKTTKMDILKNALHVNDEYILGEAFDTELQENKRKEKKEKQLIDLYEKKQIEKQKRKLSEEKPKEKIKDKKKYFEKKRSSKKRYNKIRNRSRSKSRSRREKKHYKKERKETKENYHYHHHHHHKEKKNISDTPSLSKTYKSSSSKSTEKVENDFNYNDL
jgi:serine/arginine repetitive matrix protein 2